MSAVRSRRRAAPPQAHERPAWRRAGDLIEQARGWRTPDYDPATYDMARVHGALQMIVEWVLESGEYEKHPGGVLARIARGAVCVIEESRNYGLRDSVAVAELLQELIAQVLDSTDCRAQFEGPPAVMVRGLAILAASLQDRKAAMQ